MDEPQTSNEVDQLWSEIWENDKSHNKAAEWIRKQEELLKQRQNQPWRAIDADEVAHAIKNSATGNHQEKQSYQLLAQTLCISTHEDMSKSQKRVE